jgi:hypothetical protein
MDVHLANWRAAVDEKGYPSSWRDLLATDCDHIEECDRESRKPGYNLLRKFEDIMMAWGNAKEAAFGKLLKQKQLAEEIWGTTAIRCSSDGFRSWQTQCAESSFERLQASLRHHR